MSRHRNVRSMNYEDEYYDDEDDYSRSFEDNYCISPGTAAQFTWNRERNMNLASYMGVDEVINEVEEEDKDQEDSSLQDSLNISQARSNLSDTDQARLNSCLEEIHNIMGETVPESIMVDAILRNQFSVEKSLNELLSPQDAPKPQRQSRIRNRSQDDSEDTNQLNKLLADIQSLESITKPEYHAPALLRFKSNPGSDEIDFAESLDHMDTNDENTMLKSDGSVKSLTSSSQRDRKETSLKPNISLADLAKQSNSMRNRKESDNNLKVETSVNVKNHSNGAKSSEKEKISLAQLAKLSSEKTVIQNKLNKDVSELGRSLNKKLTVQSDKKFDNEKLSLADLAKQHKSVGVSSQEEHKMKLGDSSSAFIAQHLADKKKVSSEDQNKNLVKPNASAAIGKGVKTQVLGTTPSNTSLSELANRHKTNLQGPHGSSKKESKLDAFSDANKVSKLHTQNTVSAKSSKQFSSVNLADNSMTKLSLSSCLRSSKQSIGSLSDGKVVTSSEYLGDISDAPADTFKENKAFTPLCAIESIDKSLLSMPSSSAVVFCNEQVACVNKGVKRKMNYPSFACHEQVKKRRILYPQVKLHHISAFNFSTLSPDDIVKNNQKKAFMRSDKEFNIGHS